MSKSVECNIPCKLCGSLDIAVVYRECSHIKPSYHCNKCGHSKTVDEWISAQSHEDLGKWAKPHISAMEEIIKELATEKSNKEPRISPEDVAFLRSFNKKIEDLNKEENDRIIGSVSHEAMMECLATDDPNRVTPETVLGAMKEESEAIKEYYEGVKGDRNAFYDSTRAIRHDQNKPHMDLLSPIAMFGTAQVLTKGLEKYPGSQWKKGMAWSKVIASLLRHAFKFMAGEDLDYDPKCVGCQNKSCKEHTGLPHIDCMAVNVMFLQEYYRKHKNLDDRIKTGLE